MNISEAINAINLGNQIQVTREEYLGEVRSALEAQVTEWIKDGKGIRAITAIQEVERLDRLYLPPEKVQPSEFNRRCDDRVLRGRNGDVRHIS